jgi:hypothetical protein
MVPGQSHQPLAKSATTLTLTGETAKSSVADGATLNHYQLSTPPDFTMRASLVCPL